jgi:dTDP-4-dehydrorhamnose reductase
MSKIIKILITGSSGMLGSQYLDILKKSYSTYELPSQIDIADELALNRYFLEIRPDIVVHTAAYTDVDGCEKNPVKANKINVIGTRNISNYCISKKVKLVYISSTGVYGGYKNKRYNESDIPKPLTIHHKTKLEGEEIARTNNDHLILRVGWLYGGRNDHKNNFVIRRYNEAKKLDKIFASKNQVGNPSNCRDVVLQTKLLIDNGITGTFNCVTGGVEVTRYDYIKEIILNFGLECKVLVAPPNYFKRIAPVSQNESAVNKKLINLKLNIMPSWDKSLKKYIKELELEL